jgi:hypothetical protein
MRVAALELDYVRADRKTLWARTILAAVAVAFAIDTGYRYVALHSDIEQKTVVMARGKSSGRHLPPPPATPTHSAEEYSFARQTIARLSMPWDRLFSALEAAHSERIVLLAVEPDAENRTVTVTGEAKDYLAALTYLANLAQQDSLTRVHLLHHELRRQASPRPLLFTISAAWKESP